MAEFTSLWRHRELLLEEYDTLVKDAEVNKDSELEAAIGIQRLFRGQRTRASLHVKKMAEIEIGRTFRGHLGRKKALARKLEINVLYRNSVFHYHALRIQCVLRGYHSRKTKHDYRARKKYIQQVQHNGANLRKLLNERLAEQQEEEKRNEYQNGRDEFISLTQNLHHLVGTKTTKGIYNTPHHVPTAFGMPVESQIIQQSKTHVRKNPKPIRKQYPSPPKLRGTVRSGSKLKDEQELEHQRLRFDRLRRVGDRDFNTSCPKTLPLPKHGDSFSSGTLYMDIHTNPYFKRGIPKNKDDLDPHKTTLGKGPSIPFYVAGGQKKHKIFPNDLFQH